MPPGMTKMSWYVVSKNDRMINPELERAMAEENQRQHHGGCGKPYRWSASRTLLPVRLNRRYRVNSDKKARMMNGPTSGHAIYGLYVLAAPVTGLCAVLSQTRLRPH